MGAFLGRGAGGVGGGGAVVRLNNDSDNFILSLEVVVAGRTLD